MTKFGKIKMSSNRSTLLPLSGKNKSCQFSNCVTGYKLQNFPKYVHVICNAESRLKSPFCCKTTNISCQLYQIPCLITNNDKIWKNRNVFKSFNTITSIREKQTMKVHRSGNQCSRLHSINSQICVTGYKLQNFPKYVHVM